METKGYSTFHHPTPTLSREERGSPKFLRPSVLLPIQGIGAKTLALLNRWLPAAPVSGLGFTEIVNPPRTEDWRVAFSHHQSHKKHARGFILVPSYQ